jgi:hypothetical protein
MPKKQIERASARIKQLSIGMLTTALGLTLATTAHASEWITVAAADGVVISVERDTMKRDGVIAWFWLSIQGLQQRDFNELQIYNSADCGSRQIRARQAVVLATTGEQWSANLPIPGGSRGTSGFDQYLNGNLTSAASDPMIDEILNTACQASR